MVRKEQMHRVGNTVRHKETGRMGRIVALSHARDRYLVRWSDGTCTQHTRWILVTEAKKV